MGNIAYIITIVQSKCGCIACVNANATLQNGRCETHNICLYLTMQIRNPRNLDVILRVRRVFFSSARSALNWVVYICIYIEMLKIRQTAILL